MRAWLLAFFTTGLLDSELHVTQWTSYILSRIKHEGFGVREAGVGN